MGNLLDVSQVLEIYNSYLLDIDNKNQKEREERREKAKDENKSTSIFYASSAGQCYRKQLYSAREYEAIDIVSPENRATLRLGNLLHDDVQKAILSKFNPMMHDPDITIEVEKRVYSDKLLVSGYIDIYIYNAKTNKFTVIDLKSIKQWAYKKKFGLKKNRDPNPSENYELQVGTYADILMETMGDDAYGKGSIIYCRKDDSKFKEVNVVKEYADLAQRYWAECNWLHETVDAPEDMIPGQEGVPFQKWECSYCKFKHLCDSPYKKEDK